MSFFCGYRFTTASCNIYLGLLELIVSIILVDCIHSKTQSKGNEEGVLSLHRTTYNRHCRSSDECSVDMGQDCRRLFDGCSYGQCLCKWNLSLIDNTGVCKKVFLGGSKCSAEKSSICLSGMECLHGRCQCIVGQMSTDRTFCFHKHHRLLGQSCNDFFNTCLQRSSYGYTENDMHCARSMSCKCVEGFRESGMSCLKRNNHEYGCVSSLNCEGGSVCVSGYCICPPGYTTTGVSNKCLRIGAAINRQIGEDCNELEEMAYCASGLVCQECGKLHALKCLKYLQANEYSDIFHSKGSRLLMIPSNLTFSTGNICSTVLEAIIFLYLQIVLYSIILE